MNYLCLTPAGAARLTAAQPGEGELADVARGLSALADPTRLRVALVLASAGELCVGDTATLLDLPIKLVSYHVRSLAERVLATKQRDGKLVQYRLTEDARTLLEAAFGREFSSRPAVADQRPPRTALR